MTSCKNCWHEQSHHKMIGYKRKCMETIVIELNTGGGWKDTCHCDEFEP